MLFKGITSLSPQQKEEVSSPPNLTEAGFIINHSIIRVIQAQDRSAVAVPRASDAAGKALLCPSVSNAASEVAGR